MRRRAVRSALETEGWYPATGTPGAILRDAPIAPAATPFPLVVWSHGFSGTRLDEAGILTRLASRGYVVAAVDFPLNRRDPAIPQSAPSFEDIVHQPGDLSFVIDAVSH